MTDTAKSPAGANGGAPPGLDQFFSELYRDLRQLAHAQLRRHKGRTLLDTTSLVHESYLRFLKTGQVHLADRSHFLRYAAHVMRSVIVDLARESSAVRRGGRDAHIALDTDTAMRPPTGEDQVLRVHDALQELAGISERLVQVVEMRYFAGMNESEIAEALELTDRTVRRDWEKAKLILSAALR